MPGYTFEYTLTPRDIRSYQSSWRRRRPLVLRSINFIGAAVFGGAIGILAFDKLANPIDAGDFKSGFGWALAAVLTFLATLFGDRIFL